MNGKKARDYRAQAQALADKLELPSGDYYVRKHESYVKQLVIGTNADGTPKGPNYTVQTVRLAQCMRAIYKALKRGL